MNLCVVTLRVRNAAGALAQGAVIAINSCLMSGANDTTYLSSGTTNSSGEVTFNLPYGAVVRFASNDVIELDGWNLTVPSVPTFDAGTYRGTPIDAVSVKDAAVNAAVTVNASGVTAREYGSGAIRKLVLTLSNVLVTLVKNGTTSGGGGTKLVTFAEGLVLPLLASSNLTVTAAGDKSFLASLGSAQADTGGSLSSTEANVAPSTAATTSSGAGTCKMKSTSSSPTPGSPIDGTSTPVPLYLNSALNADATGVEALYYSGTITLVYAHGGDN